MFEIGDIVEVAYGSEAEVTYGSTVWGLEGSVCSIKQVNIDKDGFKYYYLYPVKLIIKDNYHYDDSDMNCWWRDEFLSLYNEKEYKIDNMDVFLAE